MSSPRPKTPETPATFGRFESRVLRLVINDIDTDQIIPARFLKVTDRQGLGRHLFSNWRYDSEGMKKPDFALNRSENRDARVLLAGANFGCGSSREHAPWALVDWGFRAIMSTSFADIFRTNALKNSLLPIAVDADVHVELCRQLDNSPRSLVTVDLHRQILTLPDGSEARFPIDTFAKRCLSQGTDELSYILSFASQIEAYETDKAKRPP